MLIANIPFKLNTNSWQCKWNEVRISGAMASCVSFPCYFQKSPFSEEKPPVFGQWPLRHGFIHTRSLLTQPNIYAHVSSGGGMREFSQYFSWANLEKSERVLGETRMNEHFMCLGFVLMEFRKEGSKRLSNNTWARINLNEFRENDKIKVAPLPTCHSLSKTRHLA